MRSLLSSPNVASSQLLLLALPKGAINKSPDDAAFDTMKVLWQVLQWSWEAAFYNKFPEFDHAGNPWPAKSWRQQMAGQPLSREGFRACIWAVQADGEYLQNEFQLKGASHEEMCFNCSANKSTLPYNDFRPTAAWRATVVEHAGTCPTDHVISTIPGVVGESFKYDTLHVLEEGLTAHVLANVLFDLVVKPGLPGTQNERLTYLFRKICALYQEQGIEASDRIRKLTLSTFCSPKGKHDQFPTLTGVKARHCRWLVPVLEEICLEFQSTEDKYSVHRFQTVKHLNQLYTTLDCSGMHPTGEEAASFKKSMNLCLLHYSRLSVLSIQQGILQWNVTPKFHLCEHLASVFQWFNPKFYSCYAGETMVGHLSALAHSCLSGTAPYQVASKVTWRYRLALHLRIQGADFSWQDIESD